MNSNALDTLEYLKIKEKLREYAVSGLGRRRIDELSPSSDERAVAAMLNETTEARAILDAVGHVPLHGLADVTDHLEKASRGASLDPSALETMADMLRGCRKAKAFMARFVDVAPVVSGYARAITELEELEDLIGNCIENGRVSSAASQKLAKIRHRIETVKGRIKEKLSAMLTSPKYRELLQDPVITIKDDRYCIPVRASMRHQIDGTVIASSGSGSTVFIEPSAVRTLTNELKVLESEEDAEISQVLSMLTGEVAAHYSAIHLNIETMAAYDFAFAKARYSRSLSAVPAALTRGIRTMIVKGRHPLIGTGVVPLDFFIGGDFRTLLITGPNTGGKTVALKTIGLFTLMTQSGLHIPAAEGTTMGVYDKVLVDIGDKQSIEQSLSTFSGHMRNIVSILAEAGGRSLVLLDEVGTGTDPAEGSALAAAVLDDLHQAGAITVATTHYGDLKRFSETHAGFRNGCMDFDPETLMPLYRLRIGRSGKSNGFWIAERLGMSAATLEKARAFHGHPDEGAEEAAPDEVFQALPDPGTVSEPPALAGETAEQGEKTQRPLQVGDSVHIGTIGQNGIVAELADGRGNVTVLVQGKRLKVNHKRISLHIPREQLYPDDYDLNIVLLSKQDRRLVHDMNRKHVEGKVRVIQEDGGA